MALVVKDRVKQDTTTTGTGSVTLSGSYSGFDTFSEIGNANTTYYVISDPGSGDWEVGLGTYTASGTVLSRDTILASSNSGSVVTLAAGTKVVFCGYPAGKSVYLDASGNLVGIAGTVSATNLTGATVTATSKIHTPAISVTNVSATNIKTGTLGATTVSATTVSATNIHATTKIHTPSLSATYFRANGWIETPRISATAVSATNIYVATKVHTPAISATTVSATNIYATTKIHTPLISATNIVTTSITQRGSPAGHVLLVDVTISSGSSSWTVTGNLDWDKYSSFKFELALLPSVTTRLVIAFSQDVAWQTSASDYAYSSIGYQFASEFDNASNRIFIPNVANTIYAGTAGYNEFFHLEGSLFPGITDGTDIAGPFFHWTAIGHVAGTGNIGNATGVGHLRNMEPALIDGIWFQLGTGTSSGGRRRVWGVV